MSAPVDRARGQSTRPTMRDVAELAGVSLKTVSRVVNGDGNVRPNLSSRVTQAAESLHYRHNVAANLRGRNSVSIVGLLIQDVSNEFSASIFRAAEDVAAARGVQVLATNVDESESRERELVAALVARRVDGLIIVPSTQDHSYLKLEQQFGTPIVFVDRPPVGIDADRVMADNRKGAARGVRHLIAHGHRRIGFLGELPSYQPARQRYQGYCDAIGEIGDPEDVALVRRGLDTEESARLACVELLSSSTPPTAIFSAHNRLTIGAIRGLRFLSQHTTTGLVGFDDFKLADLLDPAVTVIAQNPAAMGRLAAELLFDRLAGSAGPPAEHTVPTRLIARGTGEIPGPDVARSPAVMSDNGTKKSRVRS
jgi:LacI family transcriptional regulator